MRTIFKVFIEFVTILLLFYVLCFLAMRPCEILAPQPGIEPSPPALEGALEGELLTTGPPGKSQYFYVFILTFKQLILLKFILG